MSQETVDRLVDRWINDTAFRQQLIDDLEGTVARAGWELSPEEWSSLRHVVVGLADEPLRERVSKSPGEFNN